jgi:hypothetical protein
MDSEWQWTKHLLYTEGRCGLASANIDHREDECWRVFVRAWSRYTKPETSARLPAYWTEEQVRSWCERWVAVQEPFETEAVD